MNDKKNGELNPKKVPHAGSNHTAQIKPGRLLAFSLIASQAFYLVRIGIACLRMRLKPRCLRS